jgi:hypothetical protein
MSIFDKTLKDTKRRDINLKEYQVDATLPSYIQQEFPKFVSFLKEYFKFEEQNTSTTRFLQDMFETRDISQTDVDLLQYFEDEFLLGENYFQGFSDKRTAVKYSSYLYRSKGTRYSIQQFFKTFFDIEPDIVYTKQYIFTLQDSSGDGSNIGAESARYLTDNKLYQTYAIQIRSELSVAQWRDAYKLIVHPAGMYLGGLTQIVGTGSLDALQYDPGEAIKPPIVLEGTADFDERGFAQHTALFSINNPTDETGEELKFRTNMGSVYDYPNPGGNDINDVADLTIDQLDRLYSSQAEYLTPDSPTLDDDSDGTTLYAGFDISSTETIDQERFGWNPMVSRIDSDNPLLLDSDGISLLPVGDSDSEISLREVIDGGY